jgi:hypothetical protein
MIQPQDFHVQIDYDESGVLVVVTHKPTGLQRQGRPTSTESVQHVKDKLLAQVESELYNPEDFEFLTGRCVVNGKTGTMYGATHKSTGKSRAVNSVEHQVSNTVHRDLLDELVAELWHEKAS